MGAAEVPEERVSHCVRLMLHPEYGVSQPLQQMQIEMAKYFSMDLSN